MAEHAEQTALQVIHLAAALLLDRQGPIEFSAHDDEQVFLIHRLYQIVIGPALQRGYRSLTPGRQKMNGTAAQDGALPATSISIMMSEIIRSGGTPWSSGPTPFSANPGSRSFQHITDAAHCQIIFDNQIYFCHTSTFGPGRTRRRRQLALSF
jgi:hypothetical protein